MVPVVFNSVILIFVVKSQRVKLYYKATHFVDRFWPYKGGSLCRRVNLVINWQLNAEESGLMIQAGLCSQGPYSTGTTVHAAVFAEEWTDVEVGLIADLDLQTMHICRSDDDSSVTHGWAIIVRWSVTGK